MLGQETTDTTSNRRAYPRFPASELRGLKTARVKYGPEVSVIDLSAGGVLFETEGELRPNSTIVLEFSGPTTKFLVPSRVLRCHNVATIDDTIRSEGACAFRRPLPLDDLVGNSQKGHSPAAETTRTSATGSSWQQVVGKYRDGRLVRGFTNDFSPSKPYLHVSPAPQAEETQFVSMIQLDALFFLRDARDTAPDENETMRDMATSRGRRVALALPNGKEMIGSTLSYSSDGSGFFVHPIDGFSGAVRVFVTQSGVRNIRFL